MSADPGEDTSAARPAARDRGATKDMSADPRSGNGAVTTGGAYAIAVDPDELRLASARIGALSVDVASAALAVSTQVLRLPATAALASPGTAFLVGTRLAAVTLGGDSLLAIVVRLELHAKALQIAADSYALADALSTPRADLNEIAHALPALAREGALTAMVASTPARLIELPVAAQRWIASSPEAVGAVIATIDLVAITEHSSFEQTIGILTHAGRSIGALSHERPLAVAPAASSSHRPATTIGGLLMSDDRVEHAGTRDHTAIRVHHVVHADGSGAWIVDLPGTETWAVPPGTNPSDPTADLVGMAGLRSAIYPAVESALQTSMRRAGVRPGSEPVMLVGHSQGGILATRLAQNQRFRETFQVRQLLTAGSPVDRMTIPNGVSAFNLQHTRDIVPALDGAQPPTDQANRVTLTADATPRPGDEWNPAGTHPGFRYADTAERLAGRDSPDANVRQFYRDNQAFLDPTARDDVYDYTLRRPESSDTAGQAAPSSSTAAPSN